MGEDLLVGALVDSHAKSFRTYTHHVQWTTVGETAVLGTSISFSSPPKREGREQDPDSCGLDDPSQLSITPELDQPLDILKRNLSYLSKALSTASFRRVWYQALEKLQDLLWNGVLLHHSFTTLGAAQLMHDGSVIFSLVDRYIPGGSLALDRLREGMRLLSLPPDSGGVDNSAGMTLREASDRAFTNNEEARKVLEELGLAGALTPQMARNILQRRVENNENVGW